jgi:hypothetical protein
VKTMSIALLAISLVACSDNNNAVAIPLQTIPGDYVLQTLNGSPLPFTFPDGVILNSDLLSLADGGTFSETMKLADGRTFVDTGVWTSSGNTLTITDETAGFTYSATLTGTVLTAVFPNGLKEVFHKK